MFRSGFQNVLHAVVNSSKSLLLLFPPEIIPNAH